MSKKINKSSGTMHNGVIIFEKRVLYWTIWKMLKYWVWFPYLLWWVLSSLKFLSIHFVTMKTGVIFIVSALTCAIFGSVISIISVIVEDFIGNAFFLPSADFTFSSWLQE